MRNMHSMDTTTLAATVLRAHVRVVCILCILARVLLFYWLVVCVYVFTYELVLCIGSSYTRVYRNTRETKMLKIEVLKPIHWLPIHFSNESVNLNKTDIKDGVLRIIAEERFVPKPHRGGRASTGQVLIYS